MSKRKDATSQERARIRRLMERQRADELALTPGFQSDEALEMVLKMLRTDFEPYGMLERDGHSDCSGNCRWYHVLASRRGADWGVCANPKSPRAGLLTFEHQGCPQYEWDKRHDVLEAPRGKKAQERFLTRNEYLISWRETHALVPSTELKRLR
jgi:hypothetical protein